MWGRAYCQPQAANRTGFRILTETTLSGRRGLQKGKDCRKTNGNNGSIYGNQIIQTMPRPLAKRPKSLGKTDNQPLHLTSSKIFTNTNYARNDGAGSSSGLGEFWNIEPA